jgi:hypothetical protein
MKVAYNENNPLGTAPFLTHGKEYEIEDTIEIDGESFYMIDDDDPDTAGDAEPYRVELFAVTG